MNKQNKIVGGLTFIALVALGPIWVWVVHTIHVKQGTEFGTRLATLDRQFRLFMIVAIIASVAYHWTTGPLQPNLSVVADQARLMAGQKLLQQRLDARHPCLRQPRQRAGTHPDVFAVQQPLDFFVVQAAGQPRQGPSRRVAVSHAGRSVQVWQTFGVSESGQNGHCWGS